MPTGKTCIGRHRARLFCNKAACTCPTSACNSTARHRTTPSQAACNPPSNGSTNNYRPKNIRITADGEQYQTHLSATIDQLTHRHKEQQTLLKNLTATVNTAPDNRQIRGTLRTAQAQFDEQRAHSDEIQLNLNHSRLNNTPIVLTLNSGFDWQRNTGVSLNNFKLTTLQGSGQESRFPANGKAACTGRTNANGTFWRAVCSTGSLHRLPCPTNPNGWTASSASTNWT